MTGEVISMLIAQALGATECGSGDNDMLLGKTLAVRGNM
jgi:hypothetical protein